MVSYMMWIRGGLDGRLSKKSLMFESGELGMSVADVTTSLARREANGVWRCDFLTGRVGGVGSVSTPRTGA